MAELFKYLIRDEFLERIDGGITYYDRQGNPVPPWVSIFVLSEQIRVALTEVGDLEVSTVHLPFDHSFGHGPIKIFETMVFAGDGRDRSALEKFTRRYTTEEQALQGHAEVIKEVQEWIKRE